LANNTMIAVLRRPLVGRATTTEFAGLVLFGLFLAATEAFETGRMSPPLRYLYWQMALVGGGVIAAVIEPLIARRLSGRPLVFAVAQLVAMTVMITAWVSVIPALVFGERAYAEYLLPLLPGVTTVNIAVIVLAVMIRRVLLPAALHAVSEGVAPPAIRAKLPPRLARARLIAIEAEDHYLRVRTVEGSALVLMRFSDALEALADQDGYQTHRSWWVARTAVEAARWKGGRGALALADGSSAPVSRTYAPALKGTDWAAPVA
jgi:hypothetical protein